MKLPWGAQWWELVPEAVLGAGLTLFLVTETSAATSAFKSGGAIALMVLAGAAWVAGRLLLVRYTRWPALRLVVFGVAAVAVLTVVVLPAYDNDTVVEALAPTAVTATPGQPAPGGAVTVPPAGPVALRSGPLEGIDHRASGTAVVYRQPDGSLVIGLESIDIQPGPDYDVYVVPGAGKERIAGGTRIDDLRGNKGTQYYPVPSAVNLAAGEWTVLVWCETFDVPIAGATPA